MSLLDDVTVTYNTTTKHRLTVARDGQVRIKVAKDTPDRDAEYIIAVLIVVAGKALEQDVGQSLRGSVSRDNKYNDITLYTDSKRAHHTFTW